MKFYKRFPGDITIKTGDLTLVEFGAYDRLLDHYYATEAPIEPHRVYSVARCQTASERRAVDMVLAKFWTRTDAGWVQERADEMIAEALPRIEAAKQNGKLGGRPKGSGKKPIQEPAGFSAGAPPVDAGIASQSQNQNGSDPIGSGAAGAPPPVDKSEPAKPDPAKRAAWRDCGRWMVANGMAEITAREVMGLVLKDFPAVAIDAFVAAAKQADTPDPKAYLIATAQRLAGERKDPVTVPSDDAEKTAAYLAQQAAEQQAAKAALAANGGRVPDSVREAAAKLRAQAAGAPAQEGATA